MESITKKESVPAPEPKNEKQDQNESGSVEYIDLDNLKIVPTQPSEIVIL